MRERQELRTALPHKYSSYYKICAPTLYTPCYYNGTTDQSAPTLLVDL